MTEPSPLTAIGASDLAAMVAIWSKSSYVRLDGDQFYTLYRNEKRGLLACAFLHVQEIPVALNMSGTGLHLSVWHAAAARMIATRQPFLVCCKASDGLFVATILPADLRHRAPAIFLDGDPLNNDIKPRSGFVEMPYSDFKQIGRVTRTDRVE